MPSVPGQLTRPRLILASALVGLLFCCLPHHPSHGTEPTPTYAIAKTRDGQSVAGTLTLQTDALTITPPGQPPVLIPLNQLLSLSLTGDTLDARPEERGTGIGLLGYYYRGTNLLGSPTPRLDATVQFVWAAHQQPLPDFDRDNFSARWMGYLEAPRTDDYMIHFGTDDGGRFWIDDQGPFSLWQRQEYSETNTILRLEQGRRYKIRAEFFECFGNARAHLWWSSPRMPKTPIPQDRLHPASFLLNHPAQIDSNQGLLATYYDHPAFQGKSFTRIDPAIDAHQNIDLTQPARRLREQWLPLDREARRALRALETFRSRNSGGLKQKEELITDLEAELNQIASDARQAAGRAADALRDAATTLDLDIAPGIPASFFSVRWSGQVQAAESAEYTFEIRAGEETRLWFDHQLAIDTGHSPETTRFTRTLQSGTRHPLRMETRNTDGTVAVQLLWSHPAMPPSVIPTAALTASQPARNPETTELGPNPFAPGVALENGIYIQAPVRRADPTAIHFDGILATQSLPLVRASRIHIRAISPAQLQQLQPGRAGLLFVNGDFVEGRLAALEDGRVTVSSVLFGNATFDTSTQVSVIVIRDGPGLPGPFEVQCTDGTTLHAPGIGTTPEGVTFPGSSLQIPVSALSEIRRSLPKQTGKRD